jgi:hypothetical protein
MLVTLSALIVVGTAPSFQQSAGPSQAADALAPVRQSAPPVAVTSHDSTRAWRSARRAQGDFESLRRRLLPHATLVGATGCDAVIGHYCFLQQVASDPPQEALEVVAARARLLTILDSLGAVIPGDRWILGQRVRYLIEAGRPQAADSLGVACAASATVRATTSWCFALVGYTAQQYGKFPRAAAAFSLALDELPESDRKQFEDLALLIGRAAGPYGRADGEQRDSMTAAFWRLVQPLYLTSENDLRTECLARITRMYIERDSRTTMGDWARGDDRETVLRYGPALWYTQGEARPGAMGPPPIAGIRRQPAFNFFPDARVFASPDQLAPEDWEFQNVESRPTYAPVWATSFEPLINHQVALFRRGDSAFIVAAFEVNDGGTRSEPRQAGIFAAAVDRGGVLPPFGTTIENAGAKIVSTLMAPWRPVIVSLEVLDSANHSAERTRFAPKLPVAGTRLSLSDLLLYSPIDSTPPRSLAEAVPLTLHAMTAPSNRQIGVFWETYGVRPEGETFDYAVEVEPVDEGLIHRALVGLHVTDPDRGIDIRWSESPSIDSGIASRGVTVDLSRLRPGQYRVRVMLTSGTALPIVAERSIEIL